MARLPQPGGDNGNWGDVLNDYLSQTHKSDGTIKDNVITANAIAPNSITSAKIANDAVGATAIADGSITEILLDASVQTKLNTPGTIGDGTITKAKLISAVQTSLDKADTALQVAPVTSVAARTGVVTLTKIDVALGNVDNTSDSGKPVSTAQQTALDGKQPLDTDLTAIAALTTTSFGRSLLTQTDTAAAQTTLNLSNPIVLTPTGVTATDTANMDAAVITALASDRPIYLKAGIFQRSTAWDCRGQGLTVTGAGRSLTVIKQMTANTAGILVGQTYQTFSDFTILNNAQSPSTDTNATGIECYKVSWGHFARIEVNLFARGIYIPQVDYSAPGLGTTANWVFSTHFDSLKVTGFSIQGIGQRAYGGGNTGSVWTNTYVSNNYSGTIQPSTENPVLFANCDEMTINQMNIEWISVPNTDVIGFESVFGAVVNGLHFEQLTLGAYGASLIRPYNAKVVVNGVNLCFSTIPNSGPHAVVKLSTAVDTIELVGFRQHDMTSIAGSWSLVNMDSGAAGGSSWFRQCDTGSPFTAIKTNEFTPPVVKQVNDTLYSVASPTIDSQVVNKGYVDTATGSAYNPIVLTPTGVAATDGPAMDAAVVTALATGRPIFLQAGTFRRTTEWNLRTACSLRIQGAGQDTGSNGKGTLIECTVDTVDLIGIGGFGNYLSDFTIRHANFTPTSTTGNGISFYKNAYSAFKRIDVYNAFNLIHVPQVDVQDLGAQSGTGNYGFFSDVFENMGLHNYANSGIWGHAYLGALTGSVFTNIYLQNGSPGSARSSTSNPVDLFVVDEMVFNQLNIEDHAGTGVGILLNGGQALFNGLHFERVNLNNWESAYIVSYGLSSLVVNELTIAYGDFAATGAGDYSSVFKVAAGGILAARGVWIHECTKTGSIPWYVGVGGDTNATNSLTVDIAPVVKSGSPAFTSNTPSTYANGMRRIGDTVYNSNSVATAASTITLAVADAQVQIATGSTGSRIYAMPTTGIQAGDSRTFVNNSTVSIAVNASGGTVMASVPSFGVITYLAKQATPTTAAHWLVSYANFQRVSNALSTATPTPNVDNTDVYYLSTLTVAATFGAPSGTARDGQLLRMRIRSAASQTLAWNAIYITNGVTTLPTTTVAGKTITADFQYDLAVTKWVLTAVNSVGY